MRRLSPRGLLSVCVVLPSSSSSLGVASVFSLACFEAKCAPPPPPLRQIRAREPGAASRDTLTSQRDGVRRGCAVGALPLRTCGRGGVRARSPSPSVPRRSAIRRQKGEHGNQRWGTRDEEGRRREGQPRAAWADERGQPAPEGARVVSRRRRQARIRLSSSSSSSLPPLLFARSLASLAASSGAHTNSLPPPSDILARSSSVLREEQGRKQKKSRR